MKIILLSGACFYCKIKLGGLHVMAERKYFWTQEKISYMKDAYEYTRFQNILAEHVAKYIEPSDMVCDAGCGLGYLSLELAKYCRHVTAVDISPDVLEVLDSNIGNTDRTGYSYLSNIRSLDADIGSLPEDTKFDWVVFCFFGQMPEIIDVMRRHARKGVILIRKTWNNHRLSSRVIPIERLRFYSDLEYLKEHNISYRTETFDIDLGQPLRDEKSALRFFEIYDRNENKDRWDDIVREERLAKLVPIESGNHDTQAKFTEFRYYLPMINRIGIIIID